MNATLPREAAPENKRHNYRAYSFEEKKGTLDFSPWAPLKMFRNPKLVKGFIFIELIIATFVFVIALAALSASYLAMLNLVEIARSLTVATKDAENVMERIQSTNFTKIVSSFPAGASVSPLPGQTFSLEAEQIIVTYPQGTGVDPLEIKATVSYSRKGRLLSQNIRTLRTK